MGMAIAVTSGFAGTVIHTQPSYAGGTTFKCETRKDGVPMTVAYSPDGRKVAMIRWLSNNYFSTDWNALRRCTEVSRRFQKSYDNGTLRFITAGNLNNQPVICATTKRNQPCTENNLLFTLRPGTNPKTALNQLMDRRGLVAGNPYTVRGSNRMSVNFDAYLKGATVEQGDESNANSSNTP
ncbi:hypothetical protein IJ00_25860 [Calothrix sp. 336/3]|nr:hypothetical protein IJ00_25860 [Calothrix sp. 336/3]